MSNAPNRFQVPKCMCEVVWMELGHRLRRNIVPRFWCSQQIEQTDMNLIKFTQDLYLPQVADIYYKLLQKFIDAVAELKASCKEIFDTLVQFQKSNCRNCAKNYDEKEFIKLLHAVMLNLQPIDFKYNVFAFCHCSMRTFSHYYRTYGPTYDLFCLDAAAMPSDAPCFGCNRPLAACFCDKLIADITMTNETLIQFDLMDRMAGQTLTTLVQRQIRQYVKENCQGIFDRSLLKHMESWLSDVILSWLTRIYNHGNDKIDEKDEHVQQILQNFRLKLTYFLYEIFAKNSIEQFFSIIIDYPDSIPAVEDLKTCLEKIDLRQYLIETLKCSLQLRILHPGVNTKDILTGYIAAIKTIRHLDNSGLILASVTAPIKDYLRKRSDTVRRVVTGLTEDGPSDLSEELAKGDTYRAPTEMSGNADLAAWESWYPDPVSLDYTRNNPSLSVSRSADIITMMIDIYGSNELFMNEYRNLMGERLLTQLDFSPQKEIRNLELLKIRFGENLLHSCEVMLKDVADSKRINTHIHSDTLYTDTAKFDISSLIISAQFWPPFNKEVLQLPEEIEQEFKKYTKSYEAYKGNRTLNWRHVTGRVNIELELEDRTLEMTVTPTQAVIIYHFQERTEWTLEDLSNEMKVLPTILRRRLSFWQAQGLIVEQATDVYKLTETQKPEQVSLPNAAEEEDVESVMASASDQREEELQVFWSYIVGMLTNLDSLPLERIHQMLKLFASQGCCAEFTHDELKNFLQLKKIAKTPVDLRCYQLQDDLASSTSCNLQAIYYPFLSMSRNTHWKL